MTLCWLNQCFHNILHLFFLLISSWEVFYRILFLLSNDRFLSDNCFQLAKAKTQRHLRFSIVLESGVTTIRGGSNRQLRLQFCKFEEPTGSISNLRPIILVGPVTARTLEWCPFILRCSNSESFSIWIYWVKRKLNSAQKRSFFLPKLD